MNLSQSRISAVVAVSDLERAREFYEGRLGLKPASGSAEELVYSCGEGTELVVYMSLTNAGSCTATLAAFEVENLDLEMENLRTVGIAFETYDEPGLKTDAEGVAELHGSRIAWFRDPDGNTYAISEI